jgi:hypothetical protein
LFCILFHYGRSKKKREKTAKIEVGKRRRNANGHKNSLRMHEMMRITHPIQAVTPMLLRNADGAASPHPDSEPKAFAMDAALR